MKRLMRKLILPTLLMPTMLLAQTGPAGVGNSTTNSFWIKANSGTSTSTDGSRITNWNDFSGNGINVAQTNSAQQPLFRTNFMNGYPAIEFDNVKTGTNQNDFLLGADSPKLDNTAGLTIFTVARPSELDGEARVMVSKRTSQNVDHSFMFFWYTGNNLYGDIVNTNDRFKTPTTFSSNVSYLTSLQYDGTLAQAVRSKIFVGNELKVTSGESSATIPDYASPLTIGSAHVGDGRPFGGQIAEVIIYREALNETKRIIINNYLSAKYNIPLSTNDLYTMDDIAKGDFDHEMAGIGRIGAADLYDDAQGSSIIRISDPSNLDNGEFLLWGHNKAILQATEYSDVPSGVQARLGRVWRASQVKLDGTTASVGAVNLRIDLTGLGNVDPTKLRLLLDSDNDGIFSDEVAIGGAIALGSNIYKFSGVTGIGNGTRFTVGTTNKMITPLPIELVYFNAEKSNSRSVDLQWETASETNNDHFTIERSTDLNQWEMLQNINGAGNSTSNQKYAATDDSPAQAVNYYRLKQTDYDGKYKYSDVRAVVISTAQEISLFPNPAKEVVTINRGKDATVQLYSALGQIVQIEQIVSEDATQLLISELPAGSYFVNIIENDVVSKIKMIKE